MRTRTGKALLVVVCGDPLTRVWKRNTRQITPRQINGCGNFAFLRLGLIGFFPNLTE